MKKILLLLVLLSNGIFASDRITLNMESYPLKEILHAIEERSSFYFIYNERLLDVTPLFSIAVEEETIHKTLEQLFRNTSIVYWISSPHIVLKDSSKNNNGIQGKIFDKETGETLIGATVIGNDNNYAITNKFGYYAFKNTVEINELSVSHLGYQEQKKRLKIKPEQFENFYLETKTSQLNEVQVLSKVPWNNVLKKEETTTVIDEKKIANTPSFMGVPDIYAVLRSIPGVLSNGVGTSGFNIRGGNNDQNLILFEHAPFYESTHLFGLFSLFNPSTIASLKLYKGNIPARWGGRASSVMDIRLKDGNKNKFIVSGAIGPLTSQLQLEGPLKKKKVHFLMAARRTHIDYLSALFNNKNPSNFYFYDLTGKLNFQINKNQTLVLSGFSGVDYYKSASGLGSTPLSYYLKQNALSLDWNYQSFKRTTVNFSSF